MLSPHRWVQRPHPKVCLFFFLSRAQQHCLGNCAVRSREGWVSMRCSSGRNQIKGLWEGLIPALEWLLLCQGAIKQRCVCVWSIYQSARVTVAHMSTLKLGPLGMLMRYGTPEPFPMFNHAPWSRGSHLPRWKPVHYIHLTFHFLILRGLKVAVLIRV